MSYNLAAIRQLLADAFGDDDIQNLAFDIFPDVNENFAPGMTRNQMIRDIVERAEKHGRIPDLLAYVEANNPYQYGLYADQVGTSPTRAGCRSPSNLPRQPFFFGREKELKSIAEAISPGARTWGALIDGPGGIGKTALAIRSGYLAPESDFDRKIFLSAKVRELTPHGEQPLEDFMLPNYMVLLTELARELGDDRLEHLAPNERTNAVRRLLANERALIIIDNLETFAEAEQGRLYQFLSRLPLSCKAIVTSRRRRSDIDARAIRLDRLAMPEAMALLDELAKSNTRLRRTPTPEREELYTITNGNPLLLRWLTGQLGRPASHCRTIPQARAFLEAAPKGNDPLEYIFGDLLDTFTEDETRVLAALVHFDQSAELKWVAEVAELAEMAALTALEDLADRSLLVADEVRQQFFLPPLAATFLRRKRPEAVTQTGGRLTDHVYALALANGYNEYDRFPNLEAAWPTIAAALPLFVQTNSDKDRLQNVYAALRKFLDFSGRWDEWLALNQQAEERALAVGDFYNAGWRAYNAGTVHHRRGLALEVLACADRCAIYWEKTQQAGAREKAMVMCLLGRRYGLEKNYLAAIGVFREVLALQRTIEPESIDVGVILNDLAAAEQKQGEYSAAERHYYEGLHIAKKLNDDDGIVTCTSNLASLALESQDWATAKALVLEVLPLAEKLDKQETIGHLCWRLAEALVRQGRSQEGLPYVHRAVAIFTRLRKLESLEAAQTVLQECLMK